MTGTAAGEVAGIGAGPPSGAVVLHLNGPPGVGKSTLARRWAEDHPGTLLLDVDALRTWVSGWREDFAATGGPVREVALAMISAHAGQGRDVVLPQLIGGEAELERFRTAATDVGARFVEVFLEPAEGELETRFAARAQNQPWLEAVHDLVAGTPPGHLERYAARLTRLAASRPHAARVTTRTGEVEAAYVDLCAAVARITG